MNTPAFARYWVRKLGKAENSLIKLGGGINNQVYKCGEGSGAFVVKGYRPIEIGKPDRMKAEVDFLNYAALVAPDYVPRLTYVDVERRCVILEYLEGDSYKEGHKPQAAELRAATEFLRRLNSDKNLAKRFIALDASEGFQLLTDHVTNIHERIQVMSFDHLSKENRGLATQLIASIKSKATRVETWLDHLLEQGTITNHLSPIDRCVSPSDFGFHNAIRTRTCVKFIDFEYAGWDDPAKVVADFILQPRIQIGLNHSPLSHAFCEQHQSKIIARSIVLGVILRLKWLCIILGVLQPSRLERLLTEQPESRSIDNIVSDRLAQAARYLREERPFGLHRFDVARA